MKGRISDNKRNQLKLAGNLLSDCVFGFCQLKVIIIMKRNINAFFQYKWINEFKRKKV